MTKFEKLQKKYTDAQGNIAALQKRKEELDEQKKQIEAERQKAAESGDTDLYLQKSKEAEQISAVIYVCDAQYKKAVNPVSAEEAAEAWAEYVKTANKEIEKAKAELYAVRNTMLAKLRAALTVQERALYTRETLAEFAGQHEYASGGSSGQFLDKLYPLGTINGLDILNERTYLRHVGLLSIEEGGRIGALTVGHRSY